MNWLKTTPGSDCALKFARRLLSFICGKITAILLEERLLGVLGENICDHDPYDVEDQNFGEFREKVSAIRIFRVWRCNLSVESILKYKNKSIEDTFCNWKVSSSLRISRLRIQLHLIWKPNCICKLRKKQNEDTLA